MARPQGRYRKFLLRSKDAGDDWAVSVYDSVHRVQALLKAFHHAIGGPAGGAKPSAVHALCSDVVGSSSAPVQTRDGLCTCAITAARANGCIEIVARASGRQADSRPKRQRKEDTQRPADGSLEVSPVDHRPPVGTGAS